MRPIFLPIYLYIWDLFSYLSTYIWNLFSYLSSYIWDLFSYLSSYIYETYFPTYLAIYTRPYFPTELVTKVKPNINSSSGSSTIELELASSGWCTGGCWFTMGPFFLTSGCPWPSATVKSPGFFKLGSCYRGEVKKTGLLRQGKARQGKATSNWSGFNPNPTLTES